MSRKVTLPDGRQIEMSDAQVAHTELSTQLAARIQEAAVELKAQCENVFTATLVILLHVAAQLDEGGLMTEQEFVSKCRDGYRLACKERTQKRTSS